MWCGLTRSIVEHVFCMYFRRLVKPLFESVVALPLDDPPLALAAAAVLYFLALDVRLNIHSVHIWSSKPIFIWIMLNCSLFLTL